MTLSEIETLLKQLQIQIDNNTAAIESLSQVLSGFATTDDLASLTGEVKSLQNNNTTLSNSVAELKTSINKINSLTKLIDVEINNTSNPLKYGDILQYDTDGKWHNVSVNNIGLDIPQSTTKLSELTDVVLNNLSNESYLMYDSSIGKWTNSTLKTDDDPTDLSSYLTKIEAARIYFPKTGGTITGPVTVNGYLHTLGNVTSEAAVTAKTSSI